MSKEFDLTRQPQNTYSGSGDKFMPDEGSVGRDHIDIGGERFEITRRPGRASSSPQNVGVEQVGSKNKAPEQLNREWVEYFEEHPATGADERSTQEFMKSLAVSRGLSPEDVTRDGVESLIQGNAVWKNGDSDQPINVTGYLGQGSDGREYVSVDGSEAGVPLDEIEFGQGPEPESGGGGDEPPQRPPTASAGGGGDEPPDEPEARSSRGENANPERDSVMRINREGIFSPKIISAINRAEAGTRYMSDRSKHETLLQELKNIAAMEDEEVPEDTPSFSSQKTAARMAINEQIDQLFANPDMENVFENVSPQAKDWANLMLGEIKAKKSDAEKMKAIEDVIDGMDPNNRDYTGAIATVIGALGTERTSQSPAQGIERAEASKEYDPLIEDLLEYSLERILNRADSDPVGDYPQFTFTESENISVIAHAARRFDEIRRIDFEKDNVSLPEDKKKKLGDVPGRRDMFNYLTTLANRRRTMHELYKSMNDLESFTGLVTRGLRKDGMDFVEKQLVGVSDVQVIYDKVFLSKLSLKTPDQGWLLEDDYRDGDAQALSILKDSATKHSDIFNKSYVDKDGNVQTRPLREWEIDRAFHMGRDLSGASERRVIYEILGGVPENADNFLKSIMHEPIARRLAPLKLIPDRFFGHPVAKRFIDMLKEEQKRGNDGEINNYKYGYMRGEKPVGFFGVDQGDTSIIDLTITDPKSNSWRARLMFLKNPKFQYELGGKKQTIGGFLDESKSAAIKEAEDMGMLMKIDSRASTRERVKHHHEQIKVVEEWSDSEEIRRVLNKQRLFLGTLIRYPGLTKDAKAMLWGNMARLNPSSMASLFPNETLDLVKHEFDLGDDREAAVKKWQEIAEKLWTAERMRLHDDAAFVRTGKGSASEVGKYFDRVNLTTDEREIIKKLQSLNFENNTDGKGDVEKFDDYQRELAKLNLNKKANAASIKKIKKEMGKLKPMILAGAAFPFTTFLDDAPETDWSQTSDFDFTRLLVNDHNAYQEGYGHIMGLLDDPTMKPEKAAEVLFESFEKVKGPPGIEGAQKVFEPIVRATAKLRSMNNASKWLGESLVKMARKPASPIQEYNLQAEVADDEKQTAAFLGALAQKDVISDDPAERDEFGRTQYERLRSQTESDRMAVILGSLRLMMQLLGPAFVMEFAKSLGIKL